MGNHFKKFYRRESRNHLVFRVLHTIGFRKEILGRKVEKFVEWGF